MTPSIENKSIPEKERLTESNRMEEVQDTKSNKIRLKPKLSLFNGCAIIIGIYFLI